MIKKSHLVSAIGAVVGASFALGTFAADTGDNPFQADELNLGHLSQQAGFDEHEGKCGEGKCGEGKCGEGKCGEGKCGEGKCGEGDDDDDEGEGACGEGSCGEGSCGST